MQRGEAVPIILRLTVLALLTPAWACAALTVSVSGVQGQPVPGVVVTATRLDAPAAPLREKRSAIMDQLNRTFVPQVLVVAAGTSVDFPNSDSVSHQVYSFSPPKRFQLPLYKGEAHPPVLFDRPGLVVLGCNIHDSMVGYIYVADTPWFGRTDAQGRVQFADLPAGRFRLRLWSPMVADETGSLDRDVVIAEQPVTVAIRLRHALRSAPEPRPNADGWDAY